MSQSKTQQFATSPHHTHSRTLTHPLASGAAPRVPGAWQMLILATWVNLSGASVKSLRLRKTAPGSEQGPLGPPTSREGQPQCCGYSPGSPPSILPAPPHPHPLGSPWASFLPLTFRRVGVWRVWLPGGIHRDLPKTVLAGQALSFAPCLPLAQSSWPLFQRAQECPPRLPQEKPGRQAGRCPLCPCGGSGRGSWEQEMPLRDHRRLRSVPPSAR